MELIRMVETQKKKRAPVRYVRKIMKLSTKFSKYLTLEYIAMINIL